MSINLDTLVAKPDVVERLSLIFDFRPDSDPPVFSIDGIKSIKQIGLDGAGGQFAHLPDQRIVYASSEGEAGPIAAHFEAFIQLIVMHPYWKDILHFPGGGKLEEMRRAAIALEAMTLEEEEDLRGAREFIMSELALEKPADPIEALHRAASSTGLTISDPWGSTYTSLFNRFTIDDNPAPRDLA